MISGRRIIIDDCDGVSISSIEELSCGHYIMYGPMLDFIKVIDAPGKNGENEKFVVVAFGGAVPCQTLRWIQFARSFGDKKVIKVNQAVL